MEFHQQGRFQSFDRIQQNVAALGPVHPTGIAKTDRSAAHATLPVKQLRPHGMRQPRDAVGRHAVHFR